MPKRKQIVPFERVDPDDLDLSFCEIRWRALMKLALYAELTDGDEVFPPTLIVGDSKRRVFHAAEHPWVTTVDNPPPGKEEMEYTMTRLEMHHSIMSHVVQMSADPRFDIVAAWFLAAPITSLTLGQKTPTGQVCELDLAVIPKIERKKTGAFMHFIVKDGQLVFGLCGVSRVTDFTCYCEWNMYRLPDLGMWKLEQVAVNQRKGT